MYSLHWSDGRRSYQIIGERLSVLQVYAYLIEKKYNMAIHCYLEGHEYDLETGLASLKNV